MRHAWFVIWHKGEAGYGNDMGRFTPQETPYMAGISNDYASKRFEEERFVIWVNAMLREGATRFQAIKL